MFCERTIVKYLSKYFQENEYNIEEENDLTLSKVEAVFSVAQISFATGITNRSSLVTMNNSSAIVMNC